MRLRARSLARRLALALGLPLAVVSGVACKSGERPGQRPDRAPAATATTGTDHEALCERGTFCVPPQASIEVAAPPPHGSCSVITPLPPGVPAGWEQTRRAKLRIWFHGDSTSAAQKQDPATCCYEWREHCAGRPLREGGRALVAEAMSARPAITATGREEASPPERPEGEHRRIAGSRARAAAADHWIRNALLEHASVAAFGWVALDLLALGAPADLVEGAHAAALDEVRHAHLSFSLAAEIGAAVSGPGPLSMPTLSGPPTPESVLRDTFRDGCLGEAAASLVLEAAARRARGSFGEAGAPLADTLKAMAADEARHAELAWRTVAWLAATFPGAARALREELEILRAAPPRASIVARPRRAPLAARYGVWSGDDMDDSRAAAREIALPLAERLCPEAASAHPASLS